MNLSSLLIDRTNLNKIKVASTNASNAKNPVTPIKKWQPKVFLAARWLWHSYEVWVCFTLEVAMTVTFVKLSTLIKLQLKFEGKLWG